MLALRNQVLTMTLVLALLATSFATLPSSASTSPAATLANGTVDVFSAYVANDGVVSGGSLTAGTPFMVHVAFTGLSPNTQHHGPKGYVPGQGFNWNNNTWKLGTAAWTGYTTFTTDATGAWSGWFAVCADATNTPTTGNFRAGCRKSGTTDNFYTDYVSLTTMSMVATGGWVEGHAYGSGGTSLTAYSAPLAGLLIPGSIMLSLGLIFTYNVLTGDWLSWAYGWMLIVAGVGLGLALGARLGEWGRSSTWVGIWMLVASVAVFSVFGALFGGPVLKTCAPVLLVISGLALVLGGFRKPVEKP